jgi:predicted nucleic acid-binding protein
MNVVDSSGWLEYFADGPNAAHFAKPIEATGKLIVPTLSIFEVFKRVMTQRGEDAALEAAALMRQGRVVALDDALALEAARLSFELKLLMADSVILATARAHKATLWTQDADFEHVNGVRFFPKTGSTPDRPNAPPARGRTK